MPIYEYRCASCGSRKEHLQKVSDPKLTVCPECGKETYEKQLTAAGFQLKGSGWYATDFKGAPAAKQEASDKDGTAKDASSEGNSKESAGSKEVAADKPAATTATPAASTPAGSA